MITGFQSPYEKKVKLGQEITKSPFETLIIFFSQKSWLPYYAINNFLILN